jgi:hypothetical protein
MRSSNNAFTGVYPFAGMVSDAYVKQCKLWASREAKKKTAEEITAYRYSAPIAKPSDMVKANRMKKASI